MAPDLETQKSFSDFPDDVQLNILSFLRPIEIPAFACTCRRFAALCSPSSPSPNLWFALSHRRWGSKTDLRRWPAAPSPRLYKTLDRWENLIDLESGSPPDRLMSEIYQYFANRTSHGAEMKKKKKKKKERLGSRGWPREHFVRISDYLPTPSRPLQGLWKGISEGMRLEFFLVTHDDVGGLDCRRVGDTAEPFAGYSPVFWTTDTTFLESPFSEEEDDMYRVREHLGFVGSFDCNMDWGGSSPALCASTVVMIWCFLISLVLLVILEMLRVGYGDMKMEPLGLGF